VRQRPARATCQGESVSWRTSQPRTRISDISAVAELTPVDHRSLNLGFRKTAGTAVRGFIDSQ
jgi:hypothetical protein